MNYLKDKKFDFTWRDKHTITAWDMEGTPWIGFYIPSAVGQSGLTCCRCGKQNIEKGWISAYFRYHMCETCVTTEAETKDPNKIRRI